MSPGKSVHSVNIVNIGTVLDQHLKGGRNDFNDQNRYEMLCNDTLEEYGNYNNNSTCVIDQGTPDRVIPGEPARWANEWFDYLLDCKDKTFDRKNDGIGWQRLIEDPVAVEINREYCTAINTLPKDPRGNKW